MLGVAGAVLRLYVVMNEGWRIVGKPVNVMNRALKKSGGDKKARRNVSKKQTDTAASFTLYS